VRPLNPFSLPRAIHLGATQLIAVKTSDGEVGLAVAPAVHLRFPVLKRGAQRRSLWTEAPTAVDATKALLCSDLVPYAFCPFAQTHCGDRVSGQLIIGDADFCPCR
jgi:hypothetical protein